MTEIGGCAAQSDGDVRAALRRASRCLRHRTYAAAVPPIGHAGAPETAETRTIVQLKHKHLPFTCVNLCVCILFCTDCCWLACVQVQSNVKDYREWETYLESNKKGRENMSGSNSLVMLSWYKLSGTH